MSSSSSDQGDTPGGASPLPTHGVSGLDSSATQAPKATEANTSNELQPAANLSLRAYQKEMLELSKHQNVIVAMDTGSGKTQVAIRRISLELDKASPSKFIWFLAPTVSLCSQQFESIKLQIPAATIRSITGNDEVETWNRETWAGLLKGTQILVTTYQVLLDALSHAFVKMKDLSLIVFDEGKSHNCTRNHPGRKIMMDYYHPQKERGGQVPCIMGLTASPSFRSTLKELEALEATLDARCISPTLHREDLLRCVSKPQIKPIVYSMPEPEVTPHTRSMSVLRKVYEGLDIMADPYIVHLLKDPTERNLRRAKTAIEKRDTYTQAQIKGLYNRSIEICRQFGSWAADKFLWMSISTFLGKVDTTAEFFDKAVSEEKRYMANLLRQVPVHQAPLPQDEDELSSKVMQLLALLEAAKDDVVAIVFVKERASVTMLQEVLLTSQAICNKYRIGTMVGTSNFGGKKKNLFEFEGNADVSALEKFRTGEINLLIATSVLEEGIDVPACNLVICYDQPDTPKSFVQRRGRARMRDSQLLLFLMNSADILKRWESLEEAIRVQYEDEERQRQALEKLENSEDTVSMSFTVESTGARLDFDNAKQHLQHLCSRMTWGDFVHSRPDYIIQPAAAGSGRITAQVSLPTFVPPEIRVIQSASSWLSEKNAVKDAAFQAYLALYKAGFVNENLLPFPSIDDASAVPARESVVKVGAILDPWIKTAKLWRESGTKWLYLVQYQDSAGRTIKEYDLVLPVKLDAMRSIPIYFDADNMHSIQVSLLRAIQDEEIARMPDHTSVLLGFSFAHRWPMEARDHVIRLTARNEDIQGSDIGALPFNEQNRDIVNGRCIIRDQQEAAYLFDGILDSKPPLDEVQHRPCWDYDAAPNNVPYLLLKKWTKRADFLHPVFISPGNEQVSRKRFTRVLPLPWARVDRVSIDHAAFGILIPSLIHELEVNLLVKELSETILKPVGIENLELIREAISCRSAGEPCNYERLEFLGDSVLKYCAVVHVFGKHPTMPESILTHYKDAIASNSRLCWTAINKGLSRFIVSKRFTGHKWRPLYVDDVLARKDLTADTREMSTKTLADVVEALVGAAYVDGGISKALKCLSVFLDDFDWYDIHRQQDMIFSRETSNASLPPVLEPLEDLIGYKFRQKSLLVQAMTHGSYELDAESRSLERLEFLGDAVLDYIIVRRLFPVLPPLPHHMMHTLKTVLVNGDFLAFASLEYTVNKKERALGPGHQVVEEVVPLALWQFMRHTQRVIGDEQVATSGRYKMLREELLAALQNGTHYPWSLFLQLRANKFYSDVFEAMLGAIWIDSGSVDICEAVLARFGIMSYLERAIRDGVHMVHPKEELGVLAVDQKVRYMTTRTPIVGKNSHEAHYGCKVYVGARRLAEVQNSGSKEEAQAKAAEMAVRILTNEATAMPNEALASNT
ncbi:dicer-like protein 2 [Stachybotrys elegans]|uniref:Dicer-like protein 2 n=1 Tax=Stachybotrys elegans TaxID=80388 RepID=A0A8K0SPY2_9HYPO|nr:dicer-like protein 2 [Stachybotrys elegans]